MSNKRQPPLQKNDKIQIIAEHFREILITLGLDVEDPSLQKTPERVAKMYVNEVFSGLGIDTFSDIELMENAFHDHKGKNFLIVKSRFTSFCEHHFVPMIGVAHVAYIPKKKMIGLSKISRIVHTFAKRPQVQERLTAQIADCLADLLETEDVAVTTKASHFCVIARGIEDERSEAIVHVLRGRFETDLKDQFFAS